MWPSQWNLSHLSDGYKHSINMGKCLWCVEWNKKDKLQWIKRMLVVAVLMQWIYPMHSSTFLNIALIIENACDYLVLKIIKEQQHDKSLVPWVAAGFLGLMFTFQVKCRIVKQLGSVGNYQIHVPSLTLPIKTLKNVNSCFSAFCTYWLYRKETVIWK